MFEKQVFFKHFANKNQLPGLSVKVILVENRINAGTTDETFQQYGKQDSFGHLMKSSASV